MRMIGKIFKGFPSRGSNSRVGPKKVNRGHTSQILTLEIEPTA